MPAAGLAVDALLQILSGLEGNDILSLDLDLLTRLGIKAHSGLPVFVLKRTEPDQGNSAVPFL